MSIKATYTVKPGDRISSISAWFNVESGQIIDATPEVFTAYRNNLTNELLADSTLDPGEVLLYAGDILNIPDGLIDEITKSITVKADSEDDISIFIDRKKCPLPHDFKFTEYFDACSDSFNMIYPHEPDIKNPAYKIDPNKFKDTGLPEMLIYIGNDPVLTGKIEIPANSITVSSSTQTLAGRNNTFLLEKSDPFPAMQKDFHNMKLDEIAQTVCKFYSITVEIQDDIEIGEAFKKATINDTEKPFMFLSRLARERSLTVGNTGEGKFLIHKYKKADPVAFFDIDQNFLDKIGKGLKFLGLSGLEFVFDTSDVYGSYVGKTATPDNQNLTETVSSNILKQQSVKITSYSDADALTLKSTTEWEEQKTIRNFYNNTIPYPSWLNPNIGKRWKTGDTILIRSKDANIPNPVEMLIKQIDFNAPPSDVRIAILKLLPIGVYL